MRCEITSEQKGSRRQGGDLRALERMLLQLKARLDEMENKGQTG